MDPKLVLNTNSFDLNAASMAPGWERELQGNHRPESEEYGPLAAKNKHIQAKTALRSLLKALFEAPFRALTWCVGL